MPVIDFANFQRNLFYFDFLTQQTKTIKVIKYK